jgi:hypothetical protein
LWSEKWRILRKKGWSFDFGKTKGSSVFYIPDHSKRSKDLQLGVHYFEGEEQVRSFVLQHPSHLCSVVDDHAQPISVSLEAEVKLRESSAVPLSRPHRIKMTKTSPPQEFLEIISLALQRSPLTDCVQDLNRFHDYLSNKKRAGAAELEADTLTTKKYYLQQIVNDLNSMICERLRNCIAPDTSDPVDVVALRCLNAMFELTDKDAIERVSNVMPRECLTMHLSFVQQPWVSHLPVQTCVIQLILHCVRANKQLISQIDVSFVDFLIEVCVIYSSNFGKLLIFIPVDKIFANPTRGSG